MVQRSTRESKCILTRERESLSNTMVVVQHGIDHPNYHTVSRVRCEKRSALISNVKMAETCIACAESENNLSYHQHDNRYQSATHIHIHTTNEPVSDGIHIHLISQLDRAAIETTDRKNVLAIAIDANAFTATVAALVQYKVGHDCRICCILGNKERLGSAFAKNRATQKSA
jgi:hypothetical protein